MVIIVTQTYYLIASKSTFLLSGNGIVASGVTSEVTLRVTGWVNSFPTIGAGLLGNKVGNEILFHLLADNKIILHIKAKLNATEILSTVLSIALNECSRYTGKTINLLGFTLSDTTFLPGSSITIDI